MARVCVMVASAAGLLCALGEASAQQTRLIFEVSRDAATWSSVVELSPQTTYYVRLRARLEGATALGLSGFACQPTLSNWHPEVGDTRLPFTFPGIDNTGSPTSETQYEGRAVAPTPVTNTGRMFPFGTTGQGTGSSSGLLTSFNDPGNVLRFAGSRALTPQEPTPWGVVFSQGPPTLGVPFIVSVDVEVFRYAVRTGDTFGVDQMVAGLTNLAGGRVSWVTASASNPVFHTNTVVVDTASILIPAPSAGMLLLVGIGAAARKRRQMGVSRGRKLGCL